MIQGEKSRSKLLQTVANQPKLTKVCLLNKMPKFIARQEKAQAHIKLGSE